MGCGSSRVVALNRETADNQENSVYGMGVVPAYQGIQKTAMKELFIAWDMDDVLCPLSPNICHEFVNALRKVFITDRSRTEAGITAVYDQNREAALSPEALSIYEYLKTLNVDIKPSHGPSAGRMEQIIVDYVQSATEFSVVLIVGNVAEFQEATLLARKKSILVERLLSAPGLTRLAESCNANWICSLSDFIQANGIQDWRKVWDRQTSVTFRKGVVVLRQGQGNPVDPCTENEADQGQQVQNTSQIEKDPPLVTTEPTESRERAVEIGQPPPGEGKATADASDSRVCVGKLQSERPLVMDVEIKGYPSPSIEANAEIHSLPTQQEETELHNSQQEHATVPAKFCDSTEELSKEQKPLHSACSPVGLKNEHETKVDPDLDQPSLDETSNVCQQIIPTVECASVVLEDTVDEIVSDNQEQGNDGFPAPQESDACDLNQVSNEQRFSSEASVNATDERPMLAWSTLQDDADDPNLVMQLLQRPEEQTSNSDLSRVTETVNEALEDVSRYLEDDFSSSCERTNFSAVEKTSESNESQHDIYLADVNTVNFPDSGELLEASRQCERVVRPSLAISKFRIRPALSSTISSASSIRQSDSIANPYIIGPDPVMAWKASVLRNLRAAEGMEMTVESVAELVAYPSEDVSLPLLLQEHLVDRKLATWVNEDKSIKLL